MLLEPARKYHQGDGKGVNFRRIKRWIVHISKCDEYISLQATGAYHVRAMGNGSEDKLIQGTSCNTASTRCGQGSCTGCRALSVDCSWGTSGCVRRARRPPRARSDRTRRNVDEAGRPLLQPLASPLHRVWGVDAEVWTPLVQLLQAGELRWRVQVPDEWKTAVALQKRI